MNKTLALYFIFLVLILSMVTIPINAYSKPLYPLMFLGANWSTLDGKTPFPGSIAVLSLYFTPRNDEGIEDLVVRLVLPYPLKSIEGDDEIYLAKADETVKGEVVELKANIVVPSNAKAGIYEFTAYVQYKIPLSKYVKQQKGSVFTFQLELYKQPSLSIKAFPQELSPDSISKVEFEIYYNGSVNANINIKIESDEASVIEYSPSSITLHPGGKVSVEAQLYVPPYEKLSKPIVSIKVYAEAIQLDHEVAVSRTFYYLVSEKREPSIKFNILNVEYFKEKILLSGIVLNEGNSSVENLSIEIASNASFISLEDNIINIGTLNPGEKKAFKITLKAYGSGKAILEFIITYFDNNAHTIKKYYTLEVPKTSVDIVEIGYELNDGEPLKLGEVNTLTLTIISNTNLEISSIIAELLLPIEIMRGSIVESYSKPLHLGDKATLKFSFHLPEILPYSTYELPLTVKIKLIFENGKFTIEKKVNIAAEIVKEPEIIVSLGTEELRQVVKQNITFYVQNLGTVPVRATLNAFSNELSIIAISPRTAILKPSEMVAIKTQVYCPTFKENIETVKVGLEVKYSYEGKEKVVSETFQIPIVREASLKIVELQQTPSEDGAVIKGQIVNIGDAEAKYVTLTSKITKGNASVENPTVYLGSLNSGEGTNFFVYIKTLGANEAKVSLLIEFQQPNRVWSNITKEITVYFRKPALEKTQLTGIEFSELIIPLAGLVISIVAIVVVLIKYVRRK